MTIKKVDISDLSEIESIYETARSFMRETGNETQWGSVYPSREIIIDDINDGNLYKVCEDNIEGVFAFIHGSDPTYDYIEGRWTNDLPYCAVHRVASAGRVRGMLKTIMDYCFTRTDNIKIDTHEDNKVMQHQLEKYGFKRCGTIYLENGDSRIAYQMRNE